MPRVSPNRGCLVPEAGGVQFMEIVIAFME